MINPDAVECQPDLHDPPVSCRDGNGFIHVNGPRRGSLFRGQSQVETGKPPGARRDCEPWLPAHKLNGLVGVRGFEPPAPASRRQCSTKLSYTPLSFCTQRPASKNSRFHMPCASKISDPLQKHGRGLTFPRMSAKSQTGLSPSVPSCTRCPAAFQYAAGQAGPVAGLLSRCAQLHRSPRLRS